jgi:PAS domain S-box-containing protein
LTAPSRCWIEILHNHKCQSGRAFAGPGFSRKRERFYRIFRRLVGRFLAYISAYCRLLAQKTGIRYFEFGFMKSKQTGRTRSGDEKGAVRQATAQSAADPVALPENEDSLQAFFNALDDPVFVFEPGGGILFTNPAAQNRLGYNREKLAELTIFDVHPPELRKEVAKHLAGLIAGKVTIFPIPLQAADGTCIPMETKIVPGPWLGKKALFGIAQDIADRKRLEAALRESEEKYQSLLKRSDSLAGKETPSRAVPSNDPGRAGLPQETRTILLAEDEPSLRRLIARVLRAQGYTVLEAADGNEALALAQANGVKIQLLVTDVIMPGLSSKMLAEWLKQVNPNVRVLFISGYINNNAVRDAMSKPGTFFLQKPFNPTDLSKKVREAIEAS